MLNDCTCIINVTKVFWYKIFFNLKIKGYYLIQKQNV